MDRINWPDPAPYLLALLDFLAHVPIFSWAVLFIVLLLGLWLAWESWTMSQQDAELRADMLRRLNAMDGTGFYTPDEHDEYIERTQPGALSGGVKHLREMKRAGQ